MVLLGPSQLFIMTCGFVFISRQCGLQERYIDSFDSTPHGNTPQKNYYIAFILYLLALLCQPRLLENVLFTFEILQFTLLFLKLESDLIFHSVQICKT